MDIDPLFPNQSLVALNYANVDPVAVFVVNFLAIIPLAAMLSNATEEIAAYTNETFGGLLNATFGNAVELIVSLIALFKDEIVIVQTSLIGSILSNLLLVMGMCFFLGGVNRIDQQFNVTVAQTSSSLLALAVASLMIPTAFGSWSGGRCFFSLYVSRFLSFLMWLHELTLISPPPPPLQPDKRASRKSRGALASCS